MTDGLFFTHIKEAIQAFRGAPMSEKLDHDGLARWSKEQFESAPCPKRVGTASNHCDHQISPMAHPMIAHTKAFQCCHCGRGRSEEHVPQTSGGSYVSEPHGPFAPKITVMY